MLSVSAFQLNLKFALINSFQNLILFFTDAELQFFLNKILLTKIVALA